MAARIDGIRCGIMNLARNSLTMRARWAAQIALSTLVLTAACTEDKGETDTDSTAAMTDPVMTGSTGSTDATGSTTVQPTTGGTTTDETTTGGMAVDYAMDIQPIWDMKCVSGCHLPGGIGAATGPLLGATDSYASIVNKQSSTVTMPLVTPGDPEMSYLWHKLNGTYGDVGGTGAKMPIGPSLDEPTLALIEQWILDGAKP